MGILYVVVGLPLVAIIVALLMRRAANKRRDEAAARKQRRGLNAADYRTERTRPVATASRLPRRGGTLQHMRRDDYDDEDDVLLFDSVPFGAPFGAVSTTLGQNYSDSPPEPDPMPAPSCSPDPSPASDPCPAPSDYSSPSPSPDPSPPADYSSPSPSPSFD